MVAATLNTPVSVYDVAVVGGGPQGLLYASWIKIARPEANVVVLERSKTPRHKIGESTLSGFCKALRSVGISQEALSSLFFPKNGLGFFHVDTSIDNITDAPEYILETFDETFQIERRVLEALLIANARRLGVEVLQGARVNLKRSQLSGQGSRVVYQQGAQECSLQTRLLVDATGPASVLAKHLDLHSRDAEFQNNAVWGYFKNVNRLGQRQGWPAEAQFSRDEYTQHLCFKEGWLWYIPLVSWEHLNDEQLTPMLEGLLEQPTTPSRAQLEATLGCEASDVVSIGLVLRDDRDRDYMEQGPQAIFDIYAQRYPAIANLLEGAELITDFYGKQQQYLTRAQVRSHARQVAGDGWLIIGDAAFFVDPLISPGLTGGVATAYFAAQESLQVLDGAEPSRKLFLSYERFVHTLHEALERDNQLVYMSFNHPEAIELIQRFQEIDARRHFNQHIETDYSLVDTNVWGILSPTYQVMQQQLWSVMRQAEQAVALQCPLAQQSAQDYESMVQQMKQILQSYLDQNIGLTPYRVQNSQPEAAMR